MYQASHRGDGEDEVSGDGSGLKISRKEETLELSHVATRWMEIAPHHAVTVLY